MRRSALNHGNVRLFRQVLMENESSWLFQPQRMSHRSAATNSVRMPGSHGTATQTGQPIGVVTYMLAVNFLRLCGTALSDSPFTAPQMADAYATITLANPAHRRGGELGRTVSDLDAGSRGFKGTTSRKLGRHYGAKNPYKNDAYFVNNDHARFFMRAFPNTFMALTGKLQVTPVVGRSLQRELHQMRAQASRAYQALPEAFRSFA